MHVGNNVTVIRQGSSAVLAYADKLIFFNSRWDVCSSNFTSVPKISVTTFIDYAQPLVAKEHSSWSLGTNKSHEF